MTVYIYRYIHTTTLYYLPNTTGMPHLKELSKFICMCHMHVAFLVAVTSSISICSNARLNTQLQMIRHCYTGD